MDIDVSTLKALRTKTEAGMLDCRRALAEAGGDLEGAQALLSSWGLAGVAKRAERETREGRVFIDRDGSRAACLVLACETDFVARNSGFIALGQKLARHARERGLEKTDAEMASLVSAFAGTVKENLAIRDLAWAEARPGEHLEVYLHGEGRIGVLIKARVDGSATAGQSGDGTGGNEAVELLHGIALHVAAFSPSFLDAASLSEAELEAMRAGIAEEIAGDETLRTKSAKIQAGAAEGRLRKRLAERSLLDHPFVKDEGLTVRAALEGLKDRTGCSLSILAFACLKVEDE